MVHEHVIDRGQLIIPNGEDSAVGEEVRVPRGVGQFGAWEDGFGQVGQRRCTGEVGRQGDRTGHGGVARQTGQPFGELDIDPVPLQAHILMQGQDLEMVPDQRTSQAGGGYLGAIPPWHDREGLGPIAAEHGWDAPEEIMLIPAYITEQAIHGLKREPVLHRHLIPDNQVDIGELASHFRLAGDAAGTPSCDGKGDLKLRMGGSTAGEQGGGDAGGSNAENRLPGGAQVAVEGAVQKGLPGPPGALHEEVAVRGRIQHGRDDPVEGVSLIGVELATEGGGGFRIHVGGVGGAGGSGLELGPRSVVGGQVEVG